MRLKQNEVNFEDTGTSSKLLNIYFMNILRVLLIIICELKMDLIDSEMYMSCSFCGGLSLDLNHLIAYDNFSLEIWDTSFWTFCHIWT